MNLKLEIKKCINVALKELDISVKEGEVVIDIPKLKGQGDFSTNIAMKISKRVGKNPIDIANEIIKSVDKGDKISKITIAGPGFINIYLEKEYVYSQICKIINSKSSYGKSDVGNGKKINIEFVSANPTGILHLGTGRGGAYGSNLSNILSFIGYNVTREYYINDSGNQIINLGKSLYERYKGLCGLEELLPEDGYYGQEILQIAKQIFAKYKKSKLDEELDYFVEIAVSELLIRIKKDLYEFRVEFDIWTSEKEIRKSGKIEECLKILDEKGLIYKSDGATFLKTINYGDDKDRVLIKKDGSYTYLVPDIAYHLDKINRGYDELINVLGADHHGYISRLKASIQALGYNSELLTIKIVQMVGLLRDGKEIKMSKRTGQTITISELINEIGVDATRYFYSTRSLDSQMDIDIGLAIKKSNDNPLFYIQYAHARICSIQKDAKASNVALISDIKTLNTEQSYQLLLKVLEFPSVVLSAGTKREPHVITNYLYEIATEFHSYYTKEKVLTEDKILSGEKLALVSAVKITIRNGLDLIGVSAPEKM